MSYEIYDTHGSKRQMKRKTSLLTVSCALCLTENIFGKLSAVLWKSILKLDSDPFLFCSAVSSVPQQPGAAQPGH